MEKTMFTAKEAAVEYFQGTIGYNKLLQDFKQGKIPGVKLSAKRILFRKEALDAWMKQKEDESVKPKPYFRKVNMV